MGTKIQREPTLYIDIFNTIDFGKIIDHPNILIAAHFWETERYEAAKTCYKFMRTIDDLIDNYKSDHQTIVSDEKVYLEKDVNSWISTVLNSTQENKKEKELIETVRRFHIH